MIEITKIQFCENILGQKITMASCDLVSSRDWCEYIELVLENGTILTIEISQNNGEAGLFFKEKGGKI